MLTKAAPVRFASPVELIDNTPPAFRSSPTSDDFYGGVNINCGNVSTNNNTLDNGGNAVINGNLSCKSLTVNGTQQTITGTNIQLEQGVIELLQGNTADTQVSGFAAQYVPSGSSSTEYSGIVRMPASAASTEYPGQLVCFQSATDPGLSNSTTSWTFALESMALQNLYAGGDIIVNNVVQSPQYNITNSSSFLGYGSSRGTVGSIGSSTQRNWFEIQDNSGQAPGIQFCSGGNLTFELFCSPVTSSYNPVVDNIQFYYDGTNSGPKHIFYGNGNAEFVGSLNISGASKPFSSTLFSLNDVNESSPTSGQVLTYNGSQWVNQSLPEAPTASSYATDIYVYQAGNNVSSSEDVPYYGIGFNSSNNKVNLQGYYGLTFGTVGSPVLFIGNGSANNITTQSGTVIDNGSGSASFPGSVSASGISTSNTIFLGSNTGSLTIPNEMITSFHDDSGNLGQFITEDYGSVILGMSNRSSTAYQNVPANGFLGCIGCNASGSVYTTGSQYVPYNTNPQPRNILDDGFGRIGIQMPTSIGSGLTTSGITVGSDNINPNNYYGIGIGSNGSGIWPFGVEVLGIQTLNARSDQSVHTKNNVLDDGNGNMTCNGVLTLSSTMCMPSAYCNQGEVTVNGWYLSFLHMGPSQTGTINFVGPGYPQTGWAMDIFSEVQQYINFTSCASIKGVNTVSSGGGINITIYPNRMIRFRSDGNGNIFAGLSST